MPSRAGRCRTRSSPRPVRRSTANTVRGAGAVEGDQQTLPFIANNISTSRLGQGQAPCQAGARPVHPCAPPRCSMVLERPRPTSGRGATASLCCVALYVSWIHLVPHTRGFAALKEAFEGGRPRESQESHSHHSWNYPVGVRGQVKAEYCVPMPRHTQTSLSIHLRLPGQLRCCPEWPLSTGDAAWRRLLGVL